MQSILKDNIGKNIGINVGASNTIKTATLTHLGDTYFTVTRATGELHHININRIFEIIETRGVVRSRLRLRIGRHDDHEIIIRLNKQMVHPVTS